MNNLNFDEVSYQAFLNAATDKYDFATCQRPDGSKYGTGGQCRKGTPTTPGSDDKKTSSKKSSGGSGDGVGTGKPSSSVKSGGIGEMTIKTKDDMKKMSDGELKDHMKLANKVAFQNDVSKLTKAQFNGLADQHKMAKAELESRGPKAPAPPKTTKKDPVGNVQKQQKETASLKKQMDKDVTAKAKAGKIKGVSKSDVDRIQAKKSGGTQLDKASRNEYAKQAKREQQSIKDIKADMKKNGKTPELEKRLKQAEARAEKFDKFAKTGIFTK